MRKLSKCSCLVTRIYKSFENLTWSLSLKEEHKRVLRKTFGHKREEKRDWTELHNVELRSLFYLPNIMVVKSKRGMCWTCRMQDSYNKHVHTYKHHHNQQVTDLSCRISAPSDYLQLPRWYIPGQN